MTANQQSALAALRSVSPIASRLEHSAEGEDRAADILELWQGTETALRALMGGSSLGGQALIRELRQRELISLGQAYASSCSRRKRGRPDTKAGVTAA